MLNIVYYWFPLQAFSFVLSSVYILDHSRSFFQSKNIMLFVSLKPCFIHWIGAFWGPMLNSPLALRHSSAEIGAITTSWDPKCYNVTLHFSCTKHDLWTLIWISVWGFIFTLLGEWYFKIQVLWLNLYKTKS